MPSYLNFDSTKIFRDFILSKTLSTPNGSQTFVSSSYEYQSLSDMSNVDPGSVDTNLKNDLSVPQNSNIFKPLEYIIKDNIDTIPRRADLTLYPYFLKGESYNLVGIMGSSSYNTESELFKFASSYIKNDTNGPVYSRIQQNLYSSTIGKVRVIDALEGNTATAINIFTGREPLIEGNSKITVASSLLGKGIDFLQTVAGVEFPWTEIPGDYLSNPNNPMTTRPEATTGFGKTIQDVTGAIGSLIGIQRRTTELRKPSDLLIDYTGERQKSFLFDVLSYSKYAPNYTTTARSQNTSKSFNFIDNMSQGVKTLLGLEAPIGKAYIGDDRSDDIKYAMNDFNDRPVRSSFYLGMMFDPIQTQLFEKQRNISEGGGVGNKLTWISSSSKNKLGLYNKEFNSERTFYDESLSTNYIFGENSLLSQTQELLDSLPPDGGTSKSHIANVIDQTSRSFKEGDVMLSRGSAVQYVDKFTNETTGVEYCRVWTKDRSYLNNSDTMKTTGLIRKFDGSVLTTPWNLNIYPNSNGNGGFEGTGNQFGKGIGDGFYAKKYMFSIENLAWKNSNTPGYTYNDLPYCERGPNEGRIMWFPPYDLNVNEQNSAKWEENVFIGRPEPIYTYQNTSRSGTISFMVIVDHPSILNLLVRNHFKDMSDEEADNYINAFFAGCYNVDFYDLIRKYTTLTQDDFNLIMAYLNNGNDPNEAKKFTKAIIDTPKPSSPIPNTETNQSSDISFKTTLYFKNDFPKIGKTEFTTNDEYEKLFNDYISTISLYKKDLNDGLTILTGTTGWSKNQITDYKILLNGEVTKTRPTNINLGKMVEKVNSDIDKAFTTLSTGYAGFKTKLEAIKTGLSGNTIESIKITVSSTTSAPASELYNWKLSYRRSYTILNDIFKKLSKNGDIPDLKWKNIKDKNGKSSTETGSVFDFKLLGYSQDGNITIDFVKNSGEQSSITMSTVNVNCGDVNQLTTSPQLRQTAPVTFYCRESTVNVTYKTKSPKTTNITQPQVGEIPKIRLEESSGKSGVTKKPPIDELKKIIMKTLSECYYFKKLEEDSPVQFSSLREKLRYFHPAFHSMTPEGLNSRLTFLQQCIRPGETIPIKGLSDVSDLNARNTSFGAPPICVLRIGDFYHSKVVIRDINITFDDNVWDLNPEGIGVQPMIAKVVLQVNFIGGQGLEKPITKLQNALSSNFYGNTEIYDPRSIATDNRKEFYKKTFTKEILEEMGKRSNDIIKDETAVDSKIIEGTYIGDNIGNSLNYDSLINGIYSDAESYFNAYIGEYTTIVKKYGNKLGSVLLSSTYRTIKNYEVQESGSSTTIELLGEYQKGRELSVQLMTLKKSLINTITLENITELMNLDKDMTSGVVSKTEFYLKPWVINKVSEILDNVGNPLLNTIKNRNEIIKKLDKLNFITNNQIDGTIVDSISYGVGLSGLDPTVFYGKYKDVITTIQNVSSKFNEDFSSETYIVNTSSLSTEDLSIFLSEMLSLEKNNILSIFKKDVLFTDNIIKNIEKRLIKFLSTPKEKTFSGVKIPQSKDGNSVSFQIINDPVTLLTSDQEDELKKINTTSKTLTINTLNFYRS